MDKFMTKKYFPAIRPALTALACGVTLLATHANATLQSIPDENIYAPTVEINDKLAYDPYENVNRDIFNLNMALDDAAIEPASEVYGKLPNMARQGIFNFLSHIRSPIVLVNTTLQGDWRGAGITMVRFWLNTVGGLGGVHDFATARGLKKYDEDFGQTLAVWGVPDGPYLMLPLLGPSTVRDFSGWVVDRGMDPVNWIGGGSATAFRAGRTTFTVLDTRERIDPILEAIENQGLDVYVATRSSYRLRRDGLIDNNRLKVDDLPDFDYDE